MRQCIILQLKLSSWLALLLLGACSEKATYKHTVYLNEQHWLFDEALTFPFQIKDSSLKYDVSLCIQYTNAYPFQNLHINYSLTNARNEPIDKAMKNYALFDPKTGIPLGKGWSATKSHRYLISSGHRFSQPGPYTLKLIQFMRVDRLPGIQSICILITPQASN